MEYGFFWGFDCFYIEYRLGSGMGIRDDVFVGSYLVFRNYFEDVNIDFIVKVTFVGL